jgi:hypothetical protein
VDVTNGGGGELAEVSTSIQYSGEATGWLNVARSDSGDTQVLENSASLGSLAPNTYAATVEVSAAGATNSPQSYTVSFTITAKPSTTQPTLVLTPTSLQFAAVEGEAAPPDQEVTVTNSGVDTLAQVTTSVNYLAGSDWLQVTASGEGNDQLLSNAVVLEGLAPNTYSASVSVSSAGASNDPQNYTVSLTVQPGVVVPPATDGGLSPGGDGGLSKEGGLALGLTPSLQGGCQLTAAPGAGAMASSKAFFGVALLLLLGYLRRQQG